jgi:hypothetical protein
MQTYAPPQWTTQILSLPAHSNMTQLCEMTAILPRTSFNIRTKVSSFRFGSKFVTSSMVAFMVTVQFPTALECEHHQLKDLRSGRHHRERGNCVASFRLMHHDAQNTSTSTKSGDCWIPAGPRVFRTHSPCTTMHGHLDRGHENTQRIIHMCNPTKE